MDSIFRAFASEEHDVVYHQQGLSLLGHNFNQLFTMAYEAKHDFFILLHGDITVASPIGQCWVDVIVGLMQANKLSAASAIVPIKSSLAITSSGIFLHKYDDQRYRRLTVKELKHLPDIIHRQDVSDLFGLSNPGPLFINTAVLCLNLRDFDWTRWGGFIIRSWIVWNRRRKPLPQVVPEDWQLSLDLFALGWPYAAINNTLLRVNHIGPTAYPNYGSWGSDCDDLPRGVTRSEWESS